MASHTFGPILMRASLLEANGIVRNTNEVPSASEVKRESGVLKLQNELGGGERG